MRYKHLIPLLLTVMLTLSLCGCSNNAQPQNSKATEKNQLVYVEPGRFLIKLPLLLAEAKGYFKEEGLDVKVKIAPNQRYYETLIAGESDFISCAYGSLMKINQQGKKVISICNLTNQCLYSLVTKPDIRTIADLKGKRIGVPKVGDEVTAVIRAALISQGLDPDNDVKWMAVGIEGSMIAAMKNDQVDAVGTVGEWRIHLQKVVPQTHVLIDYSKKDDLVKYLGTSTYSLACVQVTTEFAQNNPETTQKIVNAVMKSLAYINSHTPEECIDVVKDKYWADADRQDLINYLKEIKDAYSKDGITTKEGYDAVVSVNHGGGLLDLPAPNFEEITPLQYVKKADTTIK